MWDGWVGVVGLEENNVNNSKNSGIWKLPGQSARN